ncbi:MAG: DNA-deoxyinosine glycosylase [Rheinheimera sp.]|nr:MAG: DNA-deoxyinosine glycosylase [Rheinheimera sp.]
MTVALCYGLPAVWQADAQILILGSLPGVASLQAAQYYAHPRNQFWPLLQQLFGIDASLPYDERLTVLKQQRLALWDLIGAAERRGSLDSAITPASIQLNDFSALLQQLPALRAVWLNGGTAAKSWQKLIKTGLTLPATVQVFALPSTSPAHAALRFADKLQHWQQAYQQTLATNTGEFR